MPKLAHAFITFIRNELRLAVSLGVLLLLLVGLSFAVDNSYQFDFGDGDASGLESGYLAVDGGASMYPMNGNGIQYGWLDDALVFSNGAAVSSKLDRDGNQGVNSARFRITGLANNNYRLSARVGGLSTGFSTKVVVGGRNFVATTQPNQWTTLTFDAAVTDGSLELSFQRPSGTLWGVDSLVIAPSPIPAVKPTFDMTVQPSVHTVRVNGAAVYRVSINPLNGYASRVNLSIAGLVGDLSAQFTPAAALLPLVADLTISSTANTPPTQYDFVITATGQDADAYTVNQSISLVITNSSVAPIIANPGTVVGGDGSTISPGSNGSTSGGSPLDDISLTPRTSADVAKEQAMVDEYVASEAKKFAGTKEILELKDIGTINSFMPVPQVEPKTAFESSLQYLTLTGIIGTTVDSAPPATVSAPKPIGFWERFLGAMVNPVR